MRISKSKFVAGCQCPKRLYFQVHQPELAAEPGAASEAVMEVGLLARQMFPGGVEVGSEGGLDQALRTTRELVANRHVPAIFEATFEHGGVLVRADILPPEKQPLAAAGGQVYDRPRLLSRCSAGARLCRRDGP
jgi:hypothetical protein